VASGGPAAVVVTADDLGLSTGVTDGILRAYRRGIARSTSLLVTYPSSPGSDRADAAPASLEG